MAHPSQEDVRRLAEWRPPLGVLSVYLRFDPADRGRAWETELRNGLSAVLEGDGDLDHETRTALRATARRVSERFANHDRDLPRGEAGFVEVAAGDGGERWWATHLPPRADAVVCLSDRPVVAPLLCLVERGEARAVALVSAERVRLLEWAPGHLEQLESWELSIFSRDWRERKAARVADPARGQGVSAAGHDQFDERLAESRERFLGECGRLAARVCDERGLRRLVVFGAPEHARELEAAAASAGADAEIGGRSDLISVPDGRLQARLDEAMEELVGERHRELVTRALDGARSGARAAAGAQETLAALDEGRVDHLIVDAARPAQEDGVPSEALARRALESGAKVATVSGEAAELVAPVGGVAALLRY